MNSMNKKSLIQYCGNCSMPTEYCSYNDKKIYKNCLKWLAKCNPSKADELVLTTTAPIIRISKCGISRLNGIYKQQSKLHPFTYLHSTTSSLSIIRSDINELSLKRVWIITEKSRVNNSTNFIIHHYINKRIISLYPPLKQWQCIAGIRPLPLIKHIADKPNKRPVIKLTLEQEKAHKHLQQLWREYPKIPNLMQTMFIKELNESGYTADDVIWVATEKVHGANLSLMTDGKYMLSAKRTSILNYNDGFYKGWQLVVNAEKQTILKCYQYIKNNIDTTVMAIIVYGELFGGSYSCENVNEKMEEKVDSKIKYVHIQKGVDYSPKHHFYPFDIFIINGKENGYFLEWNKLTILFKECCFKVYANSIIEGNLQEIIREFDPNLFETRIPSKLSLSKPSKNYIAEGVVLRTKFGKRICIKDKADKFGEIDVNKKSKLKRNISLPTSLKDIEKEILTNILNNEREIIDLIYQCINDNRLNSVSSKIGPINHRKNYNKIVGNFTRDVWNEICLFQSDKTKTLSKNDQTTIKKFITECIRQFVTDFINESNT